MFWTPFFMNTMYKDHKLYKGDKGTSFMVDGNLHFRICAEGCKFKNNPNVYYVPPQTGIWDTAIRFRCGFSAFYIKR